MSSKSAIKTITGIIKIYTRLSSCWLDTSAVIFKTDFLPFRTLGHIPSQVKPATGSSGRHEAKAELRHCQTHLQVLAVPS